MYIDPIEQFQIKGVYLEITSACNLRCLHCYNESGDFKNSISLNRIREIVDELKTQRNTMITISGGEPLLHSDIWEILDYICRNEIQCLLITNGTMIDKNAAKNLTELGVPVQVSLNGNQMQHDKLCGNGAYQKTMNGLQELIKLGHQDVIIRGMISKANMDTMEDFLEFAFSMVNTVSLAMLSVMGRGKKIERDFDIDPFTKNKIVKRIHKFYIEKGYQEMQKSLDLSDETFTNGCPLLYGENKKIDWNPRIDSKGKVFLCQMFDKEKYSIGNINEMTLREILHSEKMNNLINYLSLSLNYIDQCITCVWKNSCGKGCIAQALGKYGIEHTDGDCSVRKHIYGERLYEKMK